MTVHTAAHLAARSWSSFICFAMDTAGQGCAQPAGGMHKEEGMPSAGFWSLLDELQIHVDKTDIARLTFWQSEFKKARDYYGATTRPT